VFGKINKMTKREAIETFRTKLRERNADSNFTNQFLYNVLLEHAQWLIKREISAGRIYRNTYFFQTLPARDVIEVSTIPECLSIKTRCKIYRTKTKVPEMWLDNDGPVMKNITSLDGSTSFTITTATQWQNKLIDPYQQMSKEKYAFFLDGHWYFPQVNPHKVNFYGFYKDDVSNVKEGCSECGDDNSCVKFLDTKFVVPDWVIAEMYSKALEQIAGVTKRMQEDEEINKNDQRKN
jgi:hypothetical protein